MNNNFKNLFDKPTLEETNILIDNTIDVQIKINKRLEKKLKKNVFKMIKWDGQTLLPGTRILKITAAACYIIFVAYIIGMPLFTPKDESDFYTIKETGGQLSSSPGNNKNIIETKLDIDAVTVMTEGYTPLSSAAPGLPIEVSYSGATIEICAEEGNLLLWNGVVENEGNRYVINDRGYVYWTPLTSEENPYIAADRFYIIIKIKQDKNIVGAAVIGLTDDSMYYYATILDSVNFPKIGGEYQDISDEYFDGVISRIKKEHTSNILANDQKNALIEFIGVHYDAETTSRKITVLGKVNDYLICFYDNAFDAAIVEITMGGYKFFNPCIGYPSALCAYAVGKDNDVYTLQQAYVNGKIDIGKAYLLLPEYMKKGTTEESDNLYNENF